MKANNQREKDRVRMARRRVKTNYAYDRARARAMSRLVDKHRQEFEALLAEERGRV